MIYSLKCQTCPASWTSEKSLSKKNRQRARKHLRAEGWRIVHVDNGILPPRLTQCLCARCNRKISSTTTLNIEVVNP